MPQGYGNLRVVTHARASDENRHDTLPNVTRRSGRGTARQSFRVDEQAWEQFAAFAQELGSDRSDILRVVMRWCVRNPAEAAAFVARIRDEDDPDVSGE